MPSRLKDLQQYKSSETSYDVTVDIEPDDMSPQMGTYFEQVSAIQILLSSINAALDKLRKAYSKSLSSTSTENQNSLRSNIKKIMKETGISIQAVKKMLTEMTDSTLKLRQEEGESAVVRIREQQNADLTRKFMNYMKTYQNMQEEYQTGYKMRMRRTLKIVNANVTEHEVEELINKPEITPQDLLQEAPKLTESQKQSLNSTYAEVYDTHKDILELERALNEIHQLFVDFATIVSEQEDMIDSIAHNVLKANDYVEKGVDNVKVSDMYRKRGRRVYICIILVVIMALAGLGIAAAIILGALKGVNAI